MKTLTDSIHTFAPAVLLEKVVSRKTLHTIRATALIGAGISGTLSLIFVFFITNEFAKLISFGLFFISLGIWIEQLLLFSYHNSHFFKGLNSIIGIEDEHVFGSTYEVAKVVLVNPSDVTGAFLSSSLGSTVLLRSNISFSALDTFLSSSRGKISSDTIVLPEEEMFTLIDLGKYLYTHDTYFAQFLKQEGVTPDVYFGSLTWVIGSYHQEKRQLRWWGKDTLSKQRGIGREWTYGIPYTLQQYARNITTSSVFSTLAHDGTYAKEKIEAIEAALAKIKASNILLVGEAGVGKIDLVMEVQRRIEEGVSLGAIDGKHIFVLDTTKIFATCGSKQALESTLQVLFDEALRSGNIIIVIENISTFIQEAASLGVYIPEFLDEYLSSPLLQVIVTDTPGAFHTHLEPLGGFTRRFTEILIDIPNNTATVQLLQSIALQNEYRYKTLFTYASLQTITTAADRYLVEGAMPDKAITLLVEVATKAQQLGESIITSDLVYTYVSEKTGVPAGPIKDTERHLLLHLEDTLHRQVIGQTQAIDAIARTMRRARAGIQSAEKPIGSFLFLGPTGVGKTETAKALAQVFFGNEKALHRLDMSEYSGPDALSRILGSQGVSGILPDMLREHPYSVLLLDEFEKGARSIHDLFLQILDEGVFTDGRGEKVNARNTIIIATSNAGSSLIMRTVAQRKELAHLSQEILLAIIKDGVFRPELINRFDSTIIFEPLTQTEQTKVAHLMLKDLQTRVQEKGYELQVTPELLHILASLGYSPEFGARPMQRVLQNVVEEAIAKKIISGEVSKGDTILLTQKDFPEVTLSE